MTATATLTSCEDILGHWEKPTPAVPASAVVPEGIVKYMKWDTGQKKLVEAEVTEAEVTKVTLQMQNTLGQVINPLSSQRRLCLQPHCPDDGR